MWYDEWDPFNWGRIGAVVAMAGVPITVGVAMILDPDGSTRWGLLFVCVGVLIFLAGTSPEIRSTWRRVRESNLPDFFRFAWPAGGFQASSDDEEESLWHQMEAEGGVEPGLLDYLKDADEAKDHVVLLVSQMTDTTNSYTSMLEEHTTALQAIDAQGMAGVRKADAALSETAREVVQYAQDMQRFEKPLGDNIEKALSSYSGAAAIQAEDFGGNVEQFVEARQSLQEFQGALARAAESISGHKKAIDGWPRISRKINYARMQASRTLDRLESRLSRAESTAGEVVAQLEEIIRRRRDDDDAS